MTRAPSEARESSPQVRLIDGGDLACGELLTLVLRQTRHEPVGTQVAIVTTDPAAPIDIPAWCHLTGNRFLGPDPERARAYLVELRHAREVVPDRPWRLVPTPAGAPAPANPPSKESSP